MVCTALSSERRLFGDGVQVLQCAMMSPSNIAHSLRQYERRLDHYPIFNLPYLVHVRRAKPLRSA